MITGNSNVEKQIAEESFPCPLARAFGKSGIAAERVPFRAHFAAFLCQTDMESKFFSRVGESC
jgi:hypothetical protein